MSRPMYGLQRTSGLHILMLSEELLVANLIVGSAESTYLGRCEAVQSQVLLGEAAWRLDCLCSLHVHAGNHGGWMN